MIFILAAICTAAIFIGFFLSMQAGILVGIFSKPIIDASWDDAFGRINTLRVVAVGFPLVILLHALKSRRRYMNMPLMRIWTVYAVYIMLASVMGIFNKDPLTYVDTVFRVLNGLAGFYMLQAYFCDQQRFRTLLQVMLLAGIFPIGVAMYQAATGAVFVERVTVGFTRNVGLYHDGIVLRFYCFQTIAAILLYWSYFVRKNGDTLIKVCLAVYGFMSLIALYKLYTKAGYINIGVWAAIWFISRRQFVPLIVILVTLLTINIINSDSIISDAEQLFYKELSALDESAASQVGEDRAFRRTLSGRWYTWDIILDRYANASVAEQIFGQGHGAGAHNDFLERLAQSGMIGLILYATLLFSIGMKIARNYLASKNPLNVIALMLFAMWIVDAIGAVPSQYTGYQWFVWGFIGLALKGVSFDPAYSNARAGRSRAAQPSPAH